MVHIGALDMYLRLRTLGLVFSVMLASAACYGERPVMMAQFCLSGDDDLHELERLIRGIAESRGYDYVDATHVVEGEEAIARADPGYKPIYFGVSGEDGTSLSAANFGLARYEVAIGLQRPGEKGGEMGFNAEVLRALRARWDVYMVPSGRGALPRGCGLAADVRRSPR